MLSAGQAIKHLTPGVLTGMQAAINSYGASLENNYYSRTAQSFEKVSGLRDFVATPMTSDKWKEIYTLFGRVPAVVEDTSTQGGGTAPEYSFEVINKRWATSFAVDLDTIADDQTGDIRKLGESLGQQFAYHQDLHVFDTLSLAAASSPTAWDGSRLFSDTHAPGSQDNNNALTLTEANFNTVVRQMRVYTDAQGQQPKMIVPNLLVVASTGEQAGLQLITSINRSADSTIWAATGAPVFNPLIVYRMNMLVVPFSLLYATTPAWYLVDTSKQFKPLLMQIRQKPTLSATGPDTDDAVKNNQITFVGRARYRCWAGDPLTISRGSIGS